MSVPGVNILLNLIQSCRSYCSYDYKNARLRETCPHKIIDLRIFQDIFAKRFNSCILKSNCFILQLLLWFQKSSLQKKKKKKKKKKNTP